MERGGSYPWIGFAWQVLFPRTHARIVAPATAAPIAFAGA
jgi:hypothetical protein